MTQQKIQINKFMPISKTNLLGIILYSTLFPTFSIIGGFFAHLTLYLSFPFLPIGYVGGMLFSGVFHSNKVYWLGLFLAIFIQSSLVFTILDGAYSRMENQRLKDTICKIIKIIFGVLVTFSIISYFFAKPINP